MRKAKMRLRGSIKDYIAVVAKIKNKDGFVITAYATPAIKDGKIIWKKN